MEERFSHEKLRVYQASMEFLGVARDVIANLPRGHNDIADQLSRASLSVPLNIAEGAGKLTRTESQRYFGIARGSALECAAIIEACRALGILSESENQAARKMLLSIVGMLSRLSLRRRPSPSA